VAENHFLLMTKILGIVLCEFQKWVPEMGFVSSHL